MKFFDYIGDVYFKASFKVEDVYYRTKRFFKYTYAFREELSTFYSWDYSSTLRMFRKCLVLLKDNIDKGYEESVSAQKKVNKIEKVIQLIDLALDDELLRVEAERVLKVKTPEFKFETKQIEGTDRYELLDLRTPEEQEISRSILKTTVNLQERYWKQLWKIVQGQDMKNWTIMKERNPEADFQDFFDGSDLRGWWT